jgi:transposase InsO family protein
MNSRWSVWLLVIIDACTRVVLGYHIVLASEYSRYDVIKTIENALEPHRAKNFTIAGLGYGAHEGVASQRMPELAYAVWERMKLDNAKANLADDTIRALCEFVGCLVDAGPRHSPDERSYIERFLAPSPAACRPACRATPARIRATCGGRGLIRRATCVCMFHSASLRNWLSIRLRATTARRIAG